MQSSSYSSSWEQAELLMQPAFIRLMDHLRRQLEQIDWVSEYETLHAWPENVTPDEQTMVLTLHDLLAQSRSLKQQEQIHSQLAELPQPIPIHLLHLKKNDQQVTFNLWELCYQICLQDYTPYLNRKTFHDLPLAEQPIDASLFDDGSEVDWMTLDRKTGDVVKAAFDTLTP